MTLGAEQKVLSIPSSILSVEKSSLVKNLGELGSKKDIKPFYEEVSKVIEEFSIPRDSDISQQQLVDYLYLRYLISLAPLLDSNNDENIKWLSYHDHLDLKIKIRILKLISPLVLHDSNFKKKYTIPKNECVDLYNQTQALIIKQFKSVYNPRIKEWEKKKNEDYLKNVNLYPTRDETFAYFNAVNAATLRNILVENEIQRREKYFIKSLVESYPNAASKVIKTMESAGYSRKEMPGLIDRTEGRSEQTKYLYKNLPKNVGNES